MDQKIKWDRKTLKYLIMRLFHDFKVGKELLNKIFKMPIIEKKINKCGYIKNLFQ